MSDSMSAPVDQRPKDHVNLEASIAWCWGIHGHACICAHCMRRTCDGLHQYGPSLVSVLMEMAAVHSRNHVLAT